MRQALSTLAVVLTILLVAPAAYAGPQAGILCYHTVQPGETLYCIARAYGVDPAAIAVQNALLNPNLIHPGQVLAIPDAYRALPAGRTCARQCPAAPACACAVSHTVVSGENLYRIALRYGVSMWRIAECNGILNLNYIRITDVLCIPTS